MTQAFSRRCAQLAVAAAAVFVACSAGRAQVYMPVERAPQGEGRAAHEVQVELTELRHLHVTSLGRILDDSPYSPRACNQTSTWTDASFTGGTYRVEAGMAEGEMFAATYTAAATDFPIQLSSSEIIFATSNATVQTVTQWSVLYYQGTPTAGSLIATYSSDDVVLPYARVGPGTAGVDVQFSIDPTDPDQLIINDNGSHSFTVAWRIDHLNQPSANPCFSGAPSCCNAFPVVDNSGDSQPTKNWLYGLNCGAFGCPPNGGWSTFGGLSSACRPTGDVVTRTSWSSINCGSGACCVNGVCSIMTQTDCQNAGGTYTDGVSSCAGITCPQVQGACCFPNGFCGIAGQQDCAGAGGTFAGANTVCGANNTCPLGGCCMPDGSCAGPISQTDCTNQGGTFRGAGTNCSTACPPPNGACCASNGFCFQTTQANCGGSGGTWYGAGVACGSGSTCPIGACCMSDGSCTPNVSAAACASAGGTYHGNGSTCSGANCPQPDGACCSSNGFCFVTSNTTCTGSGGTWAGPGTTCVDADGNGHADACESQCGTADFNNDGDVGTDQDIEAFFACLAGNCCATCQSVDFNHDGDTGTDLDIESFFRVLGGGHC